MSEKEVALISIGSCFLKFLDTSNIELARAFLQDILEVCLFVCARGWRTYFTLSLNRQMADTAPCANLAF
jgi:hypothetical protein